MQVSEEINNSIFRSGHTRLGFSSALIGSGMAFDYDWLIQYIYKATHVGVDKQLESMLLSQNIYIEFLEDVYTYDEKSKRKDSSMNNDADGSLHNSRICFPAYGSSPKLSSQATGIIVTNFCNG